MLRPGRRTPSSVSSANSAQSTMTVRCDCRLWRSPSQHFSPSRSSLWTHWSTDSRIRSFARLSVNSFAIWASALGTETQRQWCRWLGWRIIHFNRHRPVQPRSSHLPSTERGISPTANHLHLRRIRNPFSTFRMFVATVWCYVEVRYYNIYMCSIWTMIPFIVAYMQLNTNQ